MGSTRRVFAASQAPSYDYDPYGNGLQATPKLADINYAGLLYNSDSGLYLATYRVYDPVAGRFLSRDPIGESADPGGDLYPYVGGDPLNARDPSGLATLTIQAYDLIGFGVVLAFDEGGFSMTMRGGVGYGAGVSYNPKGEAPGKYPDGCPPGSRLGGHGFYGEASANVGPVEWGADAAAGENYSANGATQRYVEVNPPSWSFGSDMGAGASAAGGYQATIYPANLFKR